MNQKRAQRWATYIGIAASVAVPAVVIAQQDQAQRNPPADGTFAAQTLLRAGDVEQLRDALADAIARINDLQSNAALTVSALYNPPVVTTLAVPGAIVVAQATCSNDSDVMINCGCRGLGVTGSNSTVFQLRQQRIDLPATGRATCVCQGANSGSNDSNLASAPTCIRVP